MTPILDEIKGTLRLAWPLVLTNLAQMGISTTDVVMTGWLGPVPLAAGALGANLYYAFLLAGLGLAMATAPMLAQSFGQKSFGVRDARRTVRQGFWVCLLYLLPVWVILWHSEQVLLLLGQEQELAALAADYMRAMQWSLLPALWFVVLRSFIAARERPLAALVITLGTILVNAGLNWLLMFGHWGLPALGLVGAGVSSTVSEILMVAALVLYIRRDRRFRRYHLLGRFWRPDWPRFTELLRIGLPISLALWFEVTVFNAAAFLMGLFGAIPLAAHAIALQVASVSFMVPMGLSQAGTVRVGLAAGRQDGPGARRAGWIALGLAVGFMACMAGVMLTWPLPLVDLFLDLADPANGAVVALAVQFLGMAGLFQVFDGAQSVGAGVLRGLKDTRVPMIFAGLGYWGIGLPLGAWLAFGAGLGGKGIWVGLAVGLAVVAALMVSRWATRRLA